MTHIDPDDLAVVALHLRLASASEQGHLDACADCADELLVLERTVRAGRAAPGVRLDVPDPAVWTRLHEELGLSPAVAPLPVRADFGTASADPDLSDAAAAAEPSAVGSTAHGSDAVESDVVAASAARPVISLHRARRLWLPLAAASVIGLVAGVGGNALWQSLSMVETVTARAALDPLPGWSETGTATVEVDSDGRRQVVIEVVQHDVPSVGDAASAPLREVWLLTADATGLVSLGLLDGSSGRFAVPAGVDLGRYPLLDVSAEPDDGDPGHSGESIVRGDLRGA